MADRISSLRQAICEAVIYADVFDYPLNAQEIHRYLPGVVAGFELVEEMLHQETHFFSCQDGYYTLLGRETLAIIRQQREKIAARLWSQALRYSKAISRLPFVRMVAVTGALAMNNVKNGADIDYLIVTEPGHIWVTRAMVLLLGRISSLRGGILCPNYLISLRALAFPDKNLYAAHEVAQMIPVAGMDVYDEIRRQNDWVLNLLPNSIGTPAMPFLQSQSVPRSLSRPVLERLTQIPPFKRLEAWEMERKIRRLRREQGISAESDFSADVCKGHLHRHQYYTDRTFEERLHLYENI